VPLIEITRTYIGPIGLHCDCQS